MASQSFATALHRAFRKIETVIGITCAFFIGVFVLTGGILLMIPRNNAVDPNFGWKMALGMFTLLPEAVFLCVMSDGLRKKWTPFAPTFALSLPRWPLILRPIAGIWWMAHFLLGVAIALAIETALARGGIHGSSLLLQITVFFVISFTLAYALNLYAMLTLTAFGARERMVTAAWRWRFLLDFAIAIAAAWLGVSGLL